jgi:hypothetical protein
MNLKNNHLKPIIPSVVSTLIQLKEEFTLLKADSQETILASDTISP